MTYTVYRGTQYNITSANTAYGQVYFYHPYIVNYLNTSVENCSAAGVICVGAAGNYRHKIDVPGGPDYNNYYRYAGFEDVYYHRGSSPTCAPSMINVGAIDSIMTSPPIERKASFSETGPRVDIYAPGVMIMGAYANKPYQTYAVPDPRNSAYYLNKISGTSQATPQVTGLLACVLQARPRMNASQAKAFLTEYSVKNVLDQNAGAGTGYSNLFYLQGGNNRYLYQPFKSSIRGTITS
jgi:subtilisin family serine protease